MILNLGCGSRPDANMMNVDAVRVPGVDLVCDLDVAPWPWERESVDYIHARHVFEHVERPVLFMCEAWRVLRTDGKLDVVVPWWQSPNSFTDPTHRRHCTERTFDYWVPGTELHRDYGAMYGGARFAKDVCVHNADELHVILRKLP